MPPVGISLAPAPFETQSRDGLLKLRQLILNTSVAVLVLAPISAHADVAHDVISFLGFNSDQIDTPTATEKTEVALPKIELTPRELPAVPVAADIAVPQLSAIADKQAIAKPSIETPLHRLFCVEYARMRSGLAVFGDTKHWWDGAKNLYARASHPVEEAVMVFSGSKRLKRGHVAVVTDIVSPRQIIVDQANWQNHGEIDHATPVLDVSADNDWSAVRVWDMRSGQFGTHVYAISGFIAKALTKQTARE
jgi:hypothetical protein